MQSTSRKREPSLPRQRGHSWTTKMDRQKTQSRSISDHDVARYSGPDVSAPSKTGLNELIEEMLIRKSIEPIASLITPSKQHAADAAARPKIVSASASQKKAGAGMRERVHLNPTRVRDEHHAQPQLYLNQGYDFEQHREACPRMCHRIQGRESVNCGEALMTALTQQSVSAVVEDFSSSCILAVTSGVLVRHDTRAWRSHTRLWDCRQTSNSWRNEGVVMQTQTSKASLSTSTVGLTARRRGASTPSLMS